MLSFSGSLRIFIALEPCDMRAGINTLSALVGERLKEDAKSGSLFVFTNKRRRLLKVRIRQTQLRWISLDVICAS